MAKAGRNVGWMRMGLVAGLAVGAAAAQAQSGTQVQSGTQMQSGAPTAGAEKPAAGQAAPLRLNVEVETKAGAPITGLAAQDLTVLDNGEPRPVRGFRAVTPAEVPVELILAFDSVNARFETVGYERDQVKKFLAAEGARLPVPMTFAVLTDRGVEVAKGFSQDTAELGRVVDQSTTGLREITRRAGYWGAQERLQISLKGIHEVTQYAAGLPGRKIVLWLSPGWPLLSGPGEDLDTKQHRQIFDEVVGFSRQLREGDVTLYSLNPLGVEESLMREDYYTSFLRGIDRPERTDIADLSVQVLAVQSGGLTLSSTGVVDMIRRCLADAQSWYEVTLDPAPGERPAEYHHVEVKLDRPGAVVRTRDGYYTQP